MTTRVLMLLSVAIPAVQEADSALIAEIIRRFRAIESCSAALEIDVDVVVNEIDGIPLRPPGHATVRWRNRGGRAAIEIDGLDLDHGGISDRSARRIRLYLPGGTTESLDLKTGSFSRDQRTFLDAMSLSSDMGPSEFLWTLCGSYRSAILERRAARVSHVRGASGSRLVEITADDASGTQRIVFECAEEWGFLPRVSRMLVRRSEQWMELRRVEVRSARPARFGYVPESASLTGLRPSLAELDLPESFKRLRADYTFGEPEFAAVSVPTSIMATVPVPDQDPIFASSSVLFREPIAARGADLDRLVLPLQPLSFDDSMRVGRRSSSTTVGMIAAAASLVAGLAGLVFRKRWPLVASIAGCVTVIACAAVRVLVDSAPGPADAYDALAGLSETRSKPPPSSKTLCGVDCLYAAASLGTTTRPDYARLVKLVRPGAQGTTLETLRIVADCLDLGPLLVNPRTFVAPPSPLIAHLAPRHFVVVTALKGGGVAIVDPARGVRRADWDELRRVLSPVALSLSGRRGS